MNKGFTLIELLVVIAIIGILSSVVLASLHTARVKSCVAENSRSYCEKKLNMTRDEIDSIAGDVVKAKKESTRSEAPCDAK